MNKNQKGFTISELLVVIVVSSLLMGLVFNFFWQYWQYAERSQSDLDTFTSRLDVGDFIREAVGTSTGLITQNSIEDTNANVPDPVAGSTFWLTIHAVPSTITLSAADQPVLYFKRFSQNSSRQIIYNGTTPYEDEYVIYLNSGGELRVRTLANPSATGNAAATSCPPALATASCPSDRMLIDGIQSIERQYFSRSGNLIDYTPVYDPELGAYVEGPDFPVVEVVEYTLNVAKTPSTQSTATTKSSTIIRIALRNT